MGFKIGDLFGAGGVADLGSKLVGTLEKWIPNPNERAKAAIEAQKILEQHEFELEKKGMDLLAGQLEINKVEAASPHWFVAAWRPAIGWLCAVVLAFLYLPKITVLTVFWSIQAYQFVAGVPMTAGSLPPYPDMDTGDIMALLFAMLGIGGMRTWEKIKGADTKGMKR